MEITGILAMNNKRTIGHEGKIPWMDHAKEDMRRFAVLTKQSVIIMGRNTFDMFNKPLPGRIHVVVTSKPETLPDHHMVHGVRTWEAAKYVASQFSDLPAWFIGGAALLYEALPDLTAFELTVIDDNSDGDTKLPPFEHLFHQRHGPIKIDPCGDQLGMEFHSLVRG